MREVVQKIYRYNELSDKAKEKARESFRALMDETFDHSVITEQFKYRLDELALPSEAIGWSLSHSQGDGVAFYGRVDTDNFFGVHPDYKKKYEKLFHEGQPEFSVTLTRNSWGTHYDHWNTMTVNIDWEGDDTTDEQNTLLEELEREFTEFVQTTSRFLESAGYDMIDHMYSNERIVEGIEANEWEFHESGKPY